MGQIKGESDQTQYLTFYLAGEEFAVGILRVKEIIEYDVMTKVPMVPSYIRGVINLRGQVVPVIDLAVKFGMTPGPVGKRTCIIIIEADLPGEKTVIGIVADTVSQVIHLSSDKIEPPPAFGAKIRIDYLKGMGKSAKRFVLILDVDRVLSVNELETVASMQKTESSGEKQPAEAV